MSDSVKTEFPLTTPTERQIKRGAHRSVRELKTAITSYIDKRNADPKLFKWIRTADQIFAAIQRYCERLSA